jgi:hypothetical protein
MSQSARQKPVSEAEPVRVLGRGLRAQRGIHLTLRTLREAAGKTQVEVAQVSQIDQADISRLESRADFDDCQVATLRRYVSALGGRLEMVAEFGDKKIGLVGVAPVALPTTPANKALQRTGRKPSRR